MTKKERGRPDIYRIREFVADLKNIGDHKFFPCSKESSRLVRKAFNTYGSRFSVKFGAMSIREIAKEGKKAVLVFKGLEIYKQK